MKFWSRVRARFVRNVKEDTLAFTILWGTVILFGLALRLVVVTGVT